MPELEFKFSVEDLVLVIIQVSLNIIRFSSCLELLFVLMSQYVLISLDASGRV